MIRSVLELVIVVSLAFLAGPASAQHECGQPLSDGERPTIGDCIQIVRSVLGSAPCADCVCDVDGSGEVRLPDALRCLHAAVGADVDLACPACLETTTTLATCAPCGDALIGLADRSDLCDEDAVVYDGVKDCLCSCCDDIFCPVHTPEQETGPVCRATDALRCIRVDCLDAIKACVER